MRYCVICLLIVSAGISSTLLVPAEYPGIQYAIIAAADGDTVLVSPGTYNENVDFLAKALTVKSVSGASVTSISPRVLMSDCQDGQQSLNGFTVVGAQYDCCIRCENSTVSITDNVISGGESESGGGIRCVLCTITIEGNEVFDNTANVGAGIYLELCGGLIANNFIHSNESYPGTYFISGHGGGMHCLRCDSLVIRNNAFALNVAHYYSGYPWGFVPGCGGGLSSTSSSAGGITLLNCTFASNSANLGGALYTDTAPCITNCIIWNNPSFEVCSDYGTLAISWSDVKGGPSSIRGSGTVSWGDGMISDTPMFVAGTLSAYQLDENLSPCVDAGNPSSEYNDPEDPANPGYALWPALGLLRNDMGAYGGSGSGYWVGITEESAPSGESIQLEAYPNPCASVSTLLFEMTEPAHVVLVVYDLSGRVISSLAEGDMTAGIHATTFDGSDLASGVYLCLLKAGEAVVTSRIVLIH